MQIHPNRDRNIATILIRKSLVGKPTSEFGPLLLHELLHLVIDPIVEEHTFQLQYEVSDARLKEYQRRFRRPLEKVVEHLTNQVAPLLIHDEDIKALKAAAAVANDNRETLVSQHDDIHALRQDNEMLKLLLERNADEIKLMRKTLAQIVRNDETVLVEVQ